MLLACSAYCHFTGHRANMWMAYAHLEKANQSLNWFYRPSMAPKNLQLSPTSHFIAGWNITKHASRKNIIDMSPYEPYKPIHSKWTWTNNLIAFVWNSSPLFWHPVAGGGRFGVVICCDFIVCIFLREWQKFWPWFCRGYKVFGSLECVSFKSARSIRFKTEPVLSQRLLESLTQIPSLLKDDEVHWEKPWS